MGLRRRDHSTVIETDELESRFTIGDLIIVDVNRKFPTILRSGPGYTFSKVEPLEPGHLGIVLQVRLGHGARPWINILGPDEKIGWIPESVVGHQK